MGGRHSLSRRKLATPKAVVDIPATIAITLEDQTPIAWFAGSKSSAGDRATSAIGEAIKKLQLTERELVARAFAESRSSTIEEFVRSAVIATAKGAVVHGSRSRVDYAAACARLQKAGVEVTPNRLAREATAKNPSDPSKTISGNARSAAAWIAKNGVA